ncbi:MAG TPA: CarD family transcriptional regulator [Anaerolineaceae bacterium]|jgi:RNA polymerase-interacting CarD/CdnL/TRCF family regulator|nr:CarD family transcriptional regulator [Anaerolineaceae bacterium]
MGFKIGDKVIHGTYGLGEIVRIEEKVIRDQLVNCYVLRANDLTIWIPINELDQHSLREPVSPEDFAKLFSVLSGPAEPLPEDRVLRKDQLMAQIRDGCLNGICCTVRDLTHYQRHAKMNDNDRAILERATRSLLVEWTFVLNVPMVQAQQSLVQLLAQTSE